MAGGSRSAGGTSGGSTGSGGNAAGPVRPPSMLHADWCLPQDQQASGWADLDSAECSRRAEAVQAAAAAAVRAGSGTLLFKHVHKVRLAAL